MPMKHFFFMRVLFCKINFPSYLCFCKPSPHLYSSGPLKLENAPHSSPKCGSVPVASYDKSGGTLEGEDEKPGDKRVIILKSSLKKESSEQTAQEKGRKKRVQWKDRTGKELAEIKEFEPSEIEDSDNDGENHRGCICTIL